MSSPRSGLVPAAFAAALLTLTSLSSHALPTAKDKEDAKAAVAEARVAIGLNRFDDAAKALRRADELDPNPQTKLDLADALASGGKLIEASQILNLIIDSAPPPPKKIKDAAQKLRTDLEQRIPWIQIKVFGPAQDITSTTIDGKDIDAESEIPFNPGSHVIAADADGWQPVEKKIKLVEGSHKVVKIKMKKAGAKKKSDDEGDDDSEGSDEESDEGSAPKAKSGKITQSSLFLPGMIAGGVGVVGLGLGTIFGAMALGTTSQLQSRCDGNVCPKTSANQRLQDDAISQGNVSTAMFVIGGLGAAGGGVLLVLAANGVGQSKSKPKEEVKEEAFIRPWIGVGQAGVYGQF